MGVIEICLGILILITLVVFLIRRCQPREDGNINEDDEIGEYTDGLV